MKIRDYLKYKGREYIEMGANHLLALCPFEQHSFDFDGDPYATFWINCNNGESHCHVCKKRFKFRFINLEEEFYNQKA